MREFSGTDFVSGMARVEQGKGYAWGAASVAAAGIAATSMWQSAPVSVAFAAAALSAWCFYASSRSFGRSRTYERGAEGERALRIHLRSLLSHEYSAFFGLNLGEGGDIDSLVLGPTGIYLLEAKNHCGVISYTGDGWRQELRGKDGRLYEGLIKNPSGQARYLAGAVHKWLKRKGISAWVAPAVVFTNPAVELVLHADPGVPVVKLPTLPQLFFGRPKSPVTAVEQLRIERAILSAGGCAHEKAWGER